MQRYVNSTIDMILDRTADELIGGILVSLLLALVLAGGFALLRRKVTDATTLLTCLALATNIAAMTLAAGYIRNASRQGMRISPAARSPYPQPPMVGDRGAMLARSIFERADADHNGVLTTREAAEAAQRFVEEAEALEGGAVNEAVLRMTLRRHVGTAADVFRSMPGPGPWTGPGPGPGPILVPPRGPQPAVPAPATPAEGPAGPGTDRPGPSSPISPEPAHPPDAPRSDRPPAER